MNSGHQYAAGCPICGDPEAFPIWVDAWGPPWGCPNDLERKDGICPEQIERARREAAWRRDYPEAFDGNGVILPGGLVHILERIAS